MNMGKFQITIFIFVGIFSGMLLTPFYENYLAKDSRQYCDHDGIYFYDMSEMFRAIKKDGYFVDGFDYAYVCNVNELYIPPESEYPNIVFYGVTKGNITKIPEAISEMTGLTKLQLHDQDIKVIPSEVGALENIKILKLGGNNLESVPAEIGNLKNLEVLHLYDNRLKMLPAETGKLEKLRIADFRMNNLTSLPGEFTALSDTLELLFLGGNNFSETEKSRIINSLPNTSVFF